MTRIVLSVLALTLIAACATNEPRPQPRTEYQVGIAGPRQARADAERAHAAAPAPAKTVEGADVDVAPRLLAPHFPDYPRKLQDAGIEGRVVVRFVVETDGSVRDAQVQGKAAPELAALALGAIQRWRFAPAVKGGVPVRVRLHQPFLFQIE